MCSFFRVSHSSYNRINRRKRKILALLSLTSGLTMLVMVHHVSIIHSVGGTNHLPPFPPTTNDTPVDYFLADDSGGGTDFPPVIAPVNRNLINPKEDFRISLKSSMKKIDGSRGEFMDHKRRHIQETQLKGGVTEPREQSQDVKDWEEEEKELEVVTEDNERCCDDDFHQNPYLSEDDVVTSKINNENNSENHLQNKKNYKNDLRKTAYNNTMNSKKFLLRSALKFIAQNVTSHYSSTLNLANKNGVYLTKKNVQFPTDKEVRYPTRNVEGHNAQKDSYPTIKNLNKNNRLNDNRLNDNRLNDNRLNDNRLNDNRLNDNRLNDNRPNDNRLNDNRLNDNRLNDNRVNINRNTDNRLNNIRNESRKNSVKQMSNSNVNSSIYKNSKNVLSNSTRESLMRPHLSNIRSNKDNQGKMSGDTIININIENFVHNSPLKFIEKSILRNKTYAKELIKEIDKLSQHLLQQESKTKRKTKYKARINSPNYISNFTDVDDTEIVIPEVTVSNVSYSELKEKSLKLILNRIDLPRIFQNVSYRNAILSRDLSQWTDFLSLPEEDPGNTYEPNNIVDSPYVEKKQQRQEEKARKKEESWEQRIANDKRGPYVYDKFENLNIPNSLREIPRYKIRETFLAPWQTFSYSSKNSNKTSDRRLKHNKFGQLRNTNEEGAEGGSGPPNILYPYYLDYTRPAYFPWRSTKDECALYATRFLRGGTGRIVPLASFPGSGNTWVRYITEVLTGIFTGALYKDEILAVKGFWGEGDSINEGTTLLQKTHSFPALPEEVLEWDGRIILDPPPRKAVLLMRSPYEALVSLRHFHAAGHTGFGRYSAFSGLGWDNFTEVRASSWLQLNKAWLDLPDTHILVIHYEMLMQNLESESKRLLKFLGIPIDFGRLSCLQRYPEGKFRRPRYPKHLQGYKISQKSASIIASAIKILNRVLEKKGHQTLPTHLYSFHPPTWTPPPPPHLGDLTTFESEGLHPPPLKSN